MYPPKHTFYTQTVSLGSNFFFNTAAYFPQRPCFCMSKQNFTKKKKQQKVFHKLQIILSHILFFLRYPSVSINYPLAWVLLDSIPHHNDKLSASHILGTCITVDSNPDHVRAKLLAIHILVIQSCGLFHEPMLAVTPLVGHDYCSSQKWWYQCSDCA